MVRIQARAPDRNVKFIIWILLFPPPAVGGGLAKTETIVYPSLEDYLGSIWKRVVIHPFEVINSIISLLFFLLLLILAIPLAYINEWRHPEHPKFAWYQMFHRVVRTYFFLAGIRVEVEGREHLPPESQPVVLAANHLSHFDGFAISVAIEGRRTSAVTAPSQFFPWPFSFWFQKIGSIDVARSPEEEQRYQAALSGKEALAMAHYKLTKLRKSILIFPEGHIERHRSILPYKSGAVRMATAADVPLIPITLRGTERVFSPNKWLLRPGTIRVIFHSALPLPKDPAVVSDIPLMELLTSQLLCRIAQDLPVNYYSPGMANACRDILRLHPVTREAITASHPKKKPVLSKKNGS